ncbi:MAG: DNA polymerase III subunit delta, partial [Planctomycetota bacterium]
TRIVRGRFLRGEGGEEGEGFLSFDAPRSLNDSEGVGIGVALDEARTFPMFGGKKVIRYRARALEDEDVRALAEVAAKAPDFARILVLLTTLAKGAAKKLTAAGAIVGEARRLFDTPYGDRPEWDTALNKWTVGRCRMRGKRMTLPAAHVLTDQTGNDLAAVDSALANLVVSVGERPDIDEDAVRDLVGAGRNYAVFAFGEAIYARDAAKAFQVARSSFREGLEDRKGRKSRDPGYVAGRLLWSVEFRLKDLYPMSRLLDSGGTDAEAMKLCGRQPMIAKRLLANSKKFPAAELLSHWVELADAQAALRSAVPPDTVIEGLIPRLTEARGA